MGAVGKGVSGLAPHDPDQCFDEKPRCPTCDLYEDHTTDDRSHRNVPISRSTIIYDQIAVTVVLYVRFNRQGSVGYARHMNARIDAGQDTVQEYLRCCEGCLFTPTLGVEHILPHSVQLWVTAATNEAFSSQATVKNNEITWVGDEDRDDRFGAVA